METRTPSRRARSTSRAASCCCVFYGGVLVASGEGLGYGEGVAYFVDPGFDGPLVALFVEDEAGVARAGRTLDGGHHLFGAGHLGNSLRVDEARRFDARDAGGGQLVAQLGPDLRG